MFRLTSPYQPFTVGGHNEHFMNVQVGNSNQAKPGFGVELEALKPGYI